ncbi:phosphotransferase [Actinopolymorpha singaporensis]|uniref:Ser/Thr protein kinase RdoA involved in Cpx stress response, MazF antagonist n=1 Tax=Actinopolymorpha singaporensis TaxID=117157 RepID=A0A1H1QFL4_9ACTN|nr:phosphotransferase [Actinopolymorpha singaporensis]SDS22262.1 Ser/Thr protein kinase RdoA involved in Cpx stress response, MazF antagonist [Actinopolymorpha singaporensis]
MTARGGGPPASAPVVVDPALPLLAETMAAARATPGWTPHDAQWTPGHRCVLTYQNSSALNSSALNSSAGGSTFVVWEVTPLGADRRDFRADPDLPGLARAADPGVVSDLLSTRLGAGHSGPGQVRGCEVEPVRYRPGRQAVLRYRLTTGSGEQRILYARVGAATADPAAQEVPAALADLADRPLLPPLVARWPEYAALVHEAADGRPLSAVLRDDRVPARVRVRLAYRLGTLLARVHLLSAPAPSRSGTDVLRNVTGSLPAAEHADPEVARRLATVLDRLGAWIPASGHLVLGAGGLAPGLVLADHNRLTLLDLPEPARGPAEADLGSVLARMLWQWLGHPDQRPVLEAAGRAFVAGYERRAGRVDPEALLWWRSVRLTAFALRRYTRLDTASWSQVAGLTDCLDRLVSALPTRVAAPLAAHLLDRRAVDQALRPHLAKAAAEPAAVEVTAARLVHHVPGRHTVVRYTVRGLLSGGGPAEVVGKLFAQPFRAVLAEANLRALADGPFKTGPLRVPEPLPAPVERGLVLYRHCSGTPLDRLDGDAAVAGVRAAARWLARLHGSDVVLPRRLDLAAETARCRRWAGVLGDREPDLHALAWRLADGWALAAETAQAGPAAGDAAMQVPVHVPIHVPIHRDFHAAQVLVGESVTVLDVDDAGMGDPAFDVAQFCTYLEAGTDPTRAAALRRAFLHEYAAAAGRPYAGRTALFGAYAWLRIARNLALGNGPLPLTDGRGRVRAVARALQRGLACLDT